MGFVDRGGGREAKGASLRRSKKNPGAAAARAKTTKSATSGPADAQPTPAPLKPQLPFVDMCAAIQSRQFDADREAVIKRSHEEGGCSATIIWTPDIEKQAAVTQMCTLNRGVLYAMVGVHPDNIERTNRRLQDTWNETVTALAKAPDCVAVFSGLNLTREVGTHFAQETELKRMLESAIALELPIVVHLAPDEATIHRGIEIIAEAFGGNAEEFLQRGTAAAAAAASDAEDAVTAAVDWECPVPVIVYDAIATCAGKAKHATLLSAAGFHAMITGGICAGGSAATERDALAVARAFPVERTLLATNSPWSTPQNLPDEYMRTMRSEPSNIAFIAAAYIEAMDAAAPKFRFAAGEEAASVIEVGRHAICAALKANAVTVFDLANDAVPAVPAAASPTGDASAAAASPASGDDGIAATTTPTTVTTAGETADTAKAPKFVDPTPPAKPVAVDEERGDAGAGSGRIALPNVSPTAFYSCSKCRARLFGAPQLVTHALAARTGGVTSFKGKKASSEPVGDCRSALFVGVNDDRTHDTALVLDDEGDVKCGSCSMKLGRCAAHLRCPCGTAVPGTTARVNVAKLDFCDPNAALSTLLARSQQEAQAAAAADEADPAVDSDDEGGRKKKKPKANVKQNNVSNMGDFRNKSFNPTTKGKRAKGDDDDDA